MRYAPVRAMRDVPVSEVMDTIAERAEDTLRVLDVLENAEMMQVTRRAILASLDEERRWERDRFEALRETVTTAERER